MSRFQSVASSLAKLMDIVAGLALVGIMLLTSLDVILRYFGKPIQGAYDIVSMSAVFVIGFALPRTSWDRAHVTVDILVDTVPAIRRVFHFGTRILALFLFALLAWNLIRLGLDYSQTGECTLTLALPLYPVAFALGLCSIAQCVVLAADFTRQGDAGGEHD